MADVAQHEDYAERHLRGWLMELSQAGLLTVVEEGGRGRAWVYQVRAIPGAGDELDTVLPDPNVLPRVEEVFAS